LAATTFAGWRTTALSHALADAHAAVVVSEGSP